MLYSMKTFACPFCAEKYNRDKLVKHIEKKHDEEIPENFTAYRLAYDIVNDKPQHHGNCTICGKPTKWNEKRQKYERLCGNPNCYKKVKEIYTKRMMRVHGKTNLMDDPNHLEKMLAGRKISGKYKWSDGKIFSYTGSYERKFLEFLDKVMEYRSDEIIAPGPVLEYEYNGKTHMWITDFLILPYNLVLDVKDGGSSPNRREMKEYREKQIYKEKMITNLGVYSYLRLTDNDFGQFLGILAELKMQIVDEDKNTPLYRIHESYIEDKESSLLQEDLDIKFICDIDNMKKEDNRMECNVDEWKDGKINKLYILIDNSTIGKKLAKEYDAVYVHIEAAKRWLNDKEPPFEQYKLKEFYKENIKNYNISSIDSKDIEEFIFDYLDSLKDERVVIEGGKDVVKKYIKNRIKDKKEVALITSME